MEDVQRVEDVAETRGEGRVPRAAGRGGAERGPRDGVPTRGSWRGGGVDRGDTIYSLDGGVIVGMCRSLDVGVCRQNISFEPSIYLYYG